MIRFLIHGKERKLVGLCIGRENIDRMRANEPILVHLDELDPTIGPVDILIAAGSTDLEAQAALEKSLGISVGPETKVHIDPRRKQ